MKNTPIWIKGEENYLSIEWPEKYLNSYANLLAAHAVKSFDSLYYFV